MNSDNATISEKPQNKIAPWLVISLFVFIGAGIVATTIGCLILYLFSDKVHTEHWTKNNKNYTLTYRNDIPVKEFIDFRDGSYAEGPTSKSAASHGEWQFRTPDKENPGMDQVKTVFYWYGEIVTEAKWRANKLQEDQQLKAAKKE